ncbi:MAG: hypothetical protein ABW007_07765 [Chitinophagaceae bacterium]
MTKEEILQTIQDNIPQIKKREMAYAVEKPLIKKLYEEIFPMTRLDLNCPACLRSYIDQLLGYYHENKPKGEIKPKQSKSEGKKK